MLLPAHGFGYNACMRVLHLVPYYAPAYAFGGVVRAVEGIAQALVQRGHSVTVLTTDALDQQHRHPGPPEEDMGGVRVVRAPNISPRLRGRFNLSTPRSMRAAAARLLPDTDILHCHEFRTVENLLVTPLAAGRCPIVLSPHGTLVHSTGRSRLKSTWDRLLSPAVAQRVDHIVTLTEREQTEAQALWQHFGRRRVPARFSVVPNGVDPAAFASPAGGADFRRRYELGEGPVVLYLGRLHPRKGLDVLVRAFWQAAGPDARLVLAGPDDGMAAALAPLLDKRMILTGHLDDEGRMAALAAADLFVLPATGEGLSMAMLEAMAAGLPVVLSPDCNLPEAETAGAGLIVPPQVGPLAAALSQLLADPARREQMGRAAQALVRQRYTLAAAAAALENIYEQLITSPLQQHQEEPL